MPGLVGIIHPQLEIDRLNATLERMQGSLRAEPWYASSGHVFETAAFGRTSSEILNPGPQPVFSEDGRLCVMLDGEVYNPQYQPVRQTLLEKGHRLRGDGQAELLLHLYLAHGEDFVRDLNGTFNVVIWDTQSQKLIIANDRFGTRPFYYSTQSGFCFASEVKALLERPGFKREVDEEAVAEFFTFRHPLGDKTPFAGVHLLPPATVLVYQDGRVTLSSYWLPALDAQATPASFEECADHLSDLLRQAIGRCLNRSQRVGLLLSGGLDSRLLAGLAERNGSPLKTFTRGVPGCDDDRLGQLVAERLGAQHHFMEIRPDFLMHAARRGVWLTDGLMTSVDFYELSTLDQLKQHVDVVGFGLPAGPLGGLGLKPSLFGLTDEQLAHEIYAMRATLIRDAMQPLLFSDRFYRNTHGAALRNLAQVLHDIPFATSQLKAQYYFLRHYGPRSSMHGPVLSRSQVETYFPFADADLLDFTFRVPGQWRVGRRIEIEMLKRACPQLTEIPWQFSGLPVTHSTPKRVRLQRALYRVRKELSWRTRGLIAAPARKEQVNWPVWFRTVLRPWLEEILLSERTLTRGYFKPEGLRQLVSEHMGGRFDHSLPFGLLLTFELWNRLFIDGEPVGNG